MEKGENMRTLGHQPPGPPQVPMGQEKAEDMLDASNGCACAEGSSKKGTSPVSAHLSPRLPRRSSLRACLQARRGSTSVGLGLHCT